MSRDDQESDSSFEIEREPSADGPIRLSFRGKIDERADFSPLADLSGPLIFDLAAVERVNSAGLARWVEAMRALIERGGELTFSRCSPTVVYQLNLTSVFERAAAVESVYAPYICEASGVERTYLLQIDQLEGGKAPVYEESDGVFELDDLPERYFAFLRWAK